MKGQGKYSIFSITFGIVYTVEFYLNWTLFKYYPLTRQFHIEDQPVKAGPPISWYAWIVGALIAGALIASLIPRRWSDRLSPTFAWLAPALLIVAVLVYEKRWFV